MLSVNAFSQVDQIYQTPSPEILSLVDIQPQPLVRIDYANRYMVLLERSAFKTLEELAADEIRLAGLRINPETNSQGRKTFFYGLRARNLETGAELPVEGLPGDLRLADFSFSPDGKKIAFTHTREASVQLWLVDLTDAKAKMIFDQRLNGSFGMPYLWCPGSDALLVTVVPESRAEKPVRKPLPAGPLVQESTGKKVPVRTFQDMLKNPYDEYLFEYYTTSTVLRVDTAGTRYPVLPPAIYSGLEFSPDGLYLLVETIQKPFSYRVPYYRFAQGTSVHSHTGELLYEFYRRPAIEDVSPSFDACETGRRQIGWRNDLPHTLYWVEAADGGDPGREAEIRDIVYQQPIGFDSPVKQLVATQFRFSGITWGNDELAVVQEYWYKTRRIVTSFFNPVRPGLPKEMVFDRSSEDLYGDPGDFLTRRNEFNCQVLWHDQREGKLYLEGEGYSPEGNRPFLDAFDLKSKKTKRIWQAEGKTDYEAIIRVIDPGRARMITSIEGKFSNPNLYLRAGKKVSPLTGFPNPYTDFGEKVVSRKVFYKRSDGVELSATLYLPAAFKEGGNEKLPLLMWAYPREYKDAGQAGQVKDSPHRFVRLHYGSPVFWALRGFAVLDEASFPIVGENEQQPNDTFIEQLVGNARAAIEYLSAMGIADPGRVAVGGHSYGAFMVANLLAHSNLFAAGIARSGAYNRTLTPFGFQSEERTFWEAPDVYLKMSPFVHADQIEAPLLLIHGEADNNSGTFTMQTERIFAALNGLGKNARMVLLPYESHGYAARENVLHMLWETDEWLRRYVSGKSDGL